MKPPRQVTCCCSAPAKKADVAAHPAPVPAENQEGSTREDCHWVEGTVSAPVCEVPQVSTTLRPRDRLGGWRVRWAVGRMRYTVAPGLYAIGRPTAQSPVLVSANYKLSFDRLRSQLPGLDAWILVLDTRGVNVWCAAGKGTFGTDEIVQRIEAVRLAEVVGHRVLVVPQLGAAGVAAHEVRRRSGFRVQYGPVRAADLRAFLAAGMKATPDMRRVQFRFRDRAAVVPVELVWSAKYALLIAAGFLLLAGLGPGIYSWTRLTGAGLLSVALFLGAWAGSTVLTPLLLPWLPGRALSAKGAWLGLVFLLGIVLGARSDPALFDGWLSLAAWCLLVPTVASFMALNFTGATTYTSLSGVRREMRVAVPLQAAAAVVGVTFWLLGRFL